MTQEIREEDLVPKGMTKVRTGTRLWSEEVGIAMGESGLAERDPAYVFTNNRRFVEPRRPYYYPGSEVPGGEPQL